MRKECAQAITLAAEKIGYTLKASDLKGMDDLIYAHRKMLAREDRQAYHSMTREQQLTAAGESAMKEVMSNAVKRRQVTELAIQSSTRNDAQIKAMTDSGMGAMKALESKILNGLNGEGKIQPFEDIANGIAKEYSRRLVKFRELIDQSQFAGVEVSAKNSIDYIKESFGVDSGNPLAKAAYKEVKQILDEMIDHANRKGANIGKLENWRNPQAQSSFLVWLRGGKGGAAWKEDAFNNIDHELMVNPDGSLMTEVQIRKFIDEAYTTNITDGANKGKEGGSGDVNRMNSAHRQLHYKSPEAYLHMMEKYGAGNPFDQLTGHIERLSKQIALMDQLGPHSNAEFRRLYSNAADQSGTTNKNLVAAYEHLSGQIGTSNPVVAHVMGQVRSAFVASRLGSMLLAQFSDTNTTHAVMASMNVPMMEVNKWLGHIGTNAEGRKLARYMGLMLDQSANSIARFADGTTSLGFFGKAATLVPTIQGAHAWTNGWRGAAGMAESAKLGDLLGEHKTWASLPEKERIPLERSGITEQMFDVWKLAEAFEYNGNKLLTPEAIGNIPASEIKKLTGAKSDKAAIDARTDATIALTTFLHRISTDAVLQPNASTRAAMYGTAERGSFPYEAVATLAQFKQFPLALLRQMMVDRASFVPGENPWVWRAKLAMGMTVMGGISLVLGDFAGGKEPRDLSDPKVAGTFAFEALMKGGGATFVGELLNNLKEVGEKPQKALSIFGPAAGWLGGDVAPAGYNAIAALATGEEKYKNRFTRDLYDSVKGITPGQNLWFLRGVLHNVILDDLYEQANPGYKERAKQREMENYGREYWLGMD